MKSLQDAFQLKFNLLENANKSTITNIQQEKTHKDEENKQLREELAQLRAELNRNTENGLNYDSPEEKDEEDEDDDDNNDINYDSPEEEEEDNNDIDSGSLKDDDDVNNDINYDTECSDDEEDTIHNTSKAVHQNLNKFVSNKVYAYPNYDSSNNEDRANDICLD
jgi:hypothetical protein